MKLLKNVYYFNRKAVEYILLHVDLFFLCVSSLRESDVKNVQEIQLKCNSCMFFSPSIELQWIAECYKLPALTAFTFCQDSGG